MARKSILLIGGSMNQTTIVLTCTDIMIPRNIRGKRIVLIQESMVDPENLVYHIVRALGLPR